LQTKWKSEIAAWKKRKRQHETDQEARVSAFKEAVASGERSAVEEFFSIVLERSDYPEYFPREFAIAFNPVTKILVCDYQLPSPGALPTLKEVTYVKSRKALVEKHLSKKESEAMYDSVVYQTCLRTIHELFSADEFGVLDLVTFNGWVRDVDRGTGKDINPCILSLQVSRQVFEEIDLPRVDPKACFKTLKGVGSTKLHALAPVAPLLQLDIEDNRFVEARNIANRLSEGTNLAAMDWEDFEHLIRELFEAEFAERGAVVKITQASRDRGVDAVVFDPDPIRGGKIILQAKRYTNTVGADAVRDLYGTVVKEGANKGILITTSDFGPDSYEYVKGLPITLLSGGNLVHLLAKHGHKARIDLAEAKRIQAEKDAAARR
jgi:restriction system protein